MHRFPLFGACPPSVKWFRPQNKAAIGYSCAATATQYTLLVRTATENTPLIGQTNCISSHPHRLLPIRGKRKRWLALQLPRLILE